MRHNYKRRLISRRQVLRRSLWALPLSLGAPPLSLGISRLLAAPMAVAAPGSKACLATASQSEGPFYPVRPIESRNNLIRPAGTQEKASGKPIVVKGILTDARCQPIRNAEVQLWQADSQGRYNHPGEPSSAPLDARFFYWGMTRTDTKGAYRFTTILPAPYSAGGNWMRPPHIHFKFRSGGAESLTTQMYFPGHALNERDYLLQRVSASRRDSLVARRIGAESGAAAYRFDVVL